MSPIGVYPLGSTLHLVTKPEQQWLVQLRLSYRLRMNQDNVQFASKIYQNLGFSTPVKCWMTQQR